MSSASTGSVLVVGVPAATAPEGVPALPAPGGSPGDLLQLVDGLERHLLVGPGLVLVHAERPVTDTAGGPAHDLGLVRAALRRDDVLLRAVAGPLSRFLLLARLLGGSRAPAGVLAASIEPLLDEIRTYALLGSVAHLEHPTPTIAQHARGWVPGGCFLVDGETVQPVKHRLPRGLGRGRTAVLVAGEKHTPDWPEKLWSAVGPGTGMPRPEVVPGRSCWGTTRWAEISVTDADADLVATRLDSAPRRTCSWCAREARADRPCPFCRADTTRTPEDPS
jgi:hypothetical protein